MITDRQALSTMSDELKEEGLTLFRRGLHEEALIRFNEAADAYAAAGDLTGRGEMLNNIGVVQRVKQNWDAALAAFQAAESIFQEAGDDNRRAQTLGNLGDLYAFRGDKERAVQAYSDSAEIFAQNGDGDKQSQVLRTLSLFYLRQRQVAQSLSIMEQSYDVKPNPNPLQRLFHSLIRFALRLFGGG
jgi:tetratricopeptide (TPR) repeat protein